MKNSKILFNFFLNFLYNYCSEIKEKQYEIKQKKLVQVLEALADLPEREQKNGFRALMSAGVPAEVIAYEIYQLVLKEEKEQKYKS